MLNIVKEDPDDNRILECAVVAKADYVVSSDRHLLALKSHDGIPILSTRQLLNVLEANVRQPGGQGA